jgi:hypothetical protein
MNMNRIIAAIAATAIAFLLGVHLASPSQGGTPRPVLHGVIRTATTHPCPEEDSINCYWNDRKAGNGFGHAFYSVRVGALDARGHHFTQDCIIYWDRAYNRTYGQCYRVR